MFLIEEFSDPLFSSYTLLLALTKPECQYYSKLSRHCSNTFMIFFLVLSLLYGFCSEEMNFIPVFQ
jgi:hypothetical protein